MELGELQTCLIYIVRSCLEGGKKGCDELRGKKRGEALDAEYKIESKRQKESQRAFVKEIQQGGGNRYQELSP